MAKHGLCIDIINACNSLEIIKLLNCGYTFHCVMIGTSDLGIGISMPK